MQCLHEDKSARLIIRFVIWICLKTTRETGTLSTCVCTFVVDETLFYKSGIKADQAQGTRLGFSSVLSIHVSLSVDRSIVMHVLIFCRYI